MTPRLSGLTTRGRCLLAGGLATAGCSLVLAERDLLRAGAFVALLPALGLLLASRTRRRMRMTRTLSASRIPVGGEVQVDLALTGATLVGALRIADTVPDAAGPSPGEPPRFTVHRMPGSRRSPGRAVRLTYPLRPRLRGVHTIGPLASTVTDPLGLAEYARAVDGGDRLLVLPEVVPLRGLPPALAAGDGVSGATFAQQGQGHIDVLVREYRHGDELRRVHWRSSARHDEIMVRLEERPWRGGAVVLVDRRDAAHRGRGVDASLEFAISLAASVCAHLIARGEPISLVTEDGRSPAGTATGLDPLLDALAALRPSARVDLAGPDLPAGADVIAVLGAVGPAGLDALLARSRGGHAVLLDTATWDPADGQAGSADSAAAALRRAGWTVAVARAGTTPDRAWDALRTAGAGAGTAG